MIETTPKFHSSLAQAIAELVTLKRLEGYDYTAQAVFLHHFDAFLCKLGYQQSILSRQVVEAYIAHTAHLAPNGRYSRLSTVRVLCRHLQQSDAGSYVLRDLPVSRPALPRWYLYSHSDILSLLQRAQTLGPGGPVQPHSVYMLVGLLAVTGLRIGEALALNLGDVDIIHGRLLVRKGKFGKARYVAVDQSTVRVIERYLSVRICREPFAESAPFFVTASGRRLGYPQASDTFRRMVRACGVGHDAPQPPRLHDIRHSYACNCLLKWYDEGVDVNSKLPILATAMGHVNVGATQIYLHVTSTLLEQAARRFHGTFTSNVGLQGGVGQ